MDGEPILSHTRVSAKGRTPERWMIVLHGIYGSGRNWGSIARRLVDARPEWGCVLTDLRLHGSSKGFRAPHTLEACAADVDRMARQLGIGAEAILGHSFGGKVALVYARDHAEGVRQAWVMDSTPDSHEPTGSAWRMIEAVRSLPEEFASRQEAAEAIMGRGYPESVAQWMAINLEPAGEGYRWRLDFGAVEEMLRDFFRTDLWETVASPPPGMELHFVKATESGTLDDHSAARVEAAGMATGRVFLHRLEGGHWINTDNPEGVLGLLSARLP